MNRDNVNFQLFKRLIKRYILKPLDVDFIHELYVDYKQGIRLYDSSPTEFIVNRFESWTLGTYGNCLKRNIKK